MKVNNCLSLKNLKLLNKSNEQKITSIEYNSNEVKEGSLFVAIKGYKTDGHLYVDKAIKNGAKTIIIEKEYSSYFNYFNKINFIKSKNTRKTLSEISSLFFKNPSKKLFIFGVTGTNGKTSVSFLLNSILKKQYLKIGLIGTIKNQIGNKIILSKHTTPESRDIQQFFKKMIKEKCKYCIMEVSSHALFLNRVDDVFFRAGIFTNITQDHLDFHKSFKKYINTKKILLNLISSKGFAIINIDDNNLKKIITNNKIKIITYGIYNNADFFAKNIKMNLFGTSYNLIFMNKKYNVKLKLIGEHNVYNSLAAIAAAVTYGLKIEQVIESIANVIIKGRFQLIQGSYKVAVIVDYAHTPDGLLNVLKTAKKLSEKKIICVFGCGGDRDKEKRFIMGSIAGRYSDIVIITSDNPRTENINSIINMIEIGIKNINKNYYKVINRKNAIKKAISIANEGDIVLIAGKGHEKYQIIGTTRYLFNDIVIAKNILKGK